MKNSNGIPVNQYLSFHKNSFAIGDCSFTSNLPKTAQVASQQGKWLAQYFNNDFRSKKFQYIDRGQICYVGENKSIYQHKQNIFYGNLTKYLNNFIHVYNGINWNQKIEFMHNLFFA